MTVYFPDQEPLDPNDPVDFELLQKVNKDFTTASHLLSCGEVRALTDMYYQVQEFRKAAKNQERQHKETEEPNAINAWLGDSFRKIENNIKLSLKHFASQYAIGNWLLDFYGIGPVISAGLLAHFDIRKAPTVGHWIRFAGLDPLQQWLGKRGAEEIVNHHIVAGRKEKPAEEEIRKICDEVHITYDRFIQRLESGTRADLVSMLARRPWNQKLKTLVTFHFAECVVRTKYAPFSETLKKKTKEEKKRIRQEFKERLEKEIRQWENMTWYEILRHDHIKRPSYYGPFYDKRAAYERKKNERLEYKDQADRTLATKKIGKQTEAYGWYIKGMLPPGRIHRRCCRWMAKLFMSHLHHMCWLDYYGTDPPKPFIFSQPGHSYFIPPPNCPNPFEGKSLKELYES